MKKHLPFMLLVIAVPFLILPGCKKSERRTDTTFTLTSTHQPAPDTLTGYFTASGDPTTSGNFTMAIQLVGTDSLHCSQTLSVPTVGAITITSDCSLTTNTGAWYITSGTGSYTNLHGNGSLIMSFPEGSPGIEALHGQTWRQ